MKAASIRTAIAYVFLAQAIYVPITMVSSVLNAGPSSFLEALERVDRWLFPGDNSGLTILLLGLGVMAASLLLGIVGLIVLLCSSRAKVPLRAGKDP